MYTKGIVIYIGLIVVMFSSCDCNKYAQGVKNDSQRTFDRNKDYFYLLSFEGRIIKKNYCKECELNKYTLTLELNRLSKKPTFGSAQFPPYYNFESDTILNISVSKKLFEEGKEEDIVIKQGESANLKLNNQEYLLLDKEKYTWLPKGM